MRADRLVATLILLQRRSQVTAAEVARELEVSERTARRDLEALSVAGVPVYSQPGRRGGWRLVGGARTDLTGLNKAEARALFLVAGPARSAPPELGTALRKLVQALPEPFQAEAERVATSVMVDPIHWSGPRPESGRPVPPAHLAVVQAALAEGRQVLLAYVDRAGVATERAVSPLGLVVKASMWYLIAGTDDGRRTFRVDRVTGAELLAETVEPGDFDLNSAWDEVIAAVDRLRAPIKVELAVSSEMVEPITWLFGTGAAIGTALPDGRMAVTVRGGDAERVAERIAGFGGAVEVLHPQAARYRLALIGAQLVDRYGDESHRRSRGEAHRGL